MNGIKNGGMARLLNTAASMLLFLMFAVCMLIIIGAAAGIYSRINESHEVTYGSAAAIRYVSNKIRAADECVLSADGREIVITSGGIACIIYERSGGLYEKTASAGSEMKPEGGDLIFEIDSMSIAETEGLYEISVSCKGGSSAVLVRKG